MVFIDVWSILLKIVILDGLGVENLLKFRLLSGIFWQLSFLMKTGSGILMVVPHVLIFCHGYVGRPIHVCDAKLPCVFIDGVGSCSVVKAAMLISS